MAVVLSVFKTAACGVQADGCLLYTSRLHREAMWACDVRPVGQEPDGRSFTGFAFTSPCGQKGYLLLFRENVPESAFTFTRMPQKARLRLLCANGPAGQGYTPAGDLCLRFAAPRTYAFYQWQT